MAKPTENLNFAESAPAANISEPSATRPGGYNFREPLPHNEANWLFRTLFRCVRWALGLFDADGWLTMGSQYGRLRVTSDTALLHEITHEDVGGFLTRFSANLTRGDVALEVGLYGQFQRTEDDGDLSQITHINNEGGGGRLEAQLRSGSLAPLDAEPATGSMLKRDEALFLGNLPKAAGIVQVQWDSGGAVAAVSVTGYNVASATLQQPGSGYTFHSVLLTFTDTFAPAALVVSLSLQAASSHLPSFVQASGTRLLLISDAGVDMLDDVATNGYANGSAFLHFVAF